MSQEPAPSPPPPFRILWEDRVVATFETATGLDPWRRTLRAVGDKLVGDVEDDLRANLLPGSPQRDDGSQHTVTFLQGAISDRAFEAWVAAADDDDTSGGPVDLLIDVAGGNDEPPDRYRLDRCSVQRFVGRGRGRDRAGMRVTRLDVACAGWDWEAPEGPSPAGSPAIGPGATSTPVLSPSPEPETTDGTAPPNLVVGLPNLVPPPRQKPSVEQTPAAGQASPAPAPSPSSAFASPAPLDQPPTAVDDVYVAYAYPNILNVDPPGVLTNDRDPEGAVLVAVLVAKPTHGSVSLSSDGSFAYTPEARYAGTDTFTYRAVANGAYSNEATVEITVYAA